MVSSNSLKKYIIDDYDMDLVGIADAEELANEPTGHRPFDILPGAKTIIVFGRKLIDGAVQTAFRGYEEKNISARTSYKSYAQEMAPMYLLMNDTNNICIDIEDNYGAVAVPLPFGQQQYGIWDKYPAPTFTDPYAQGLPIDINKAAMAAGLGEFGWSCRFLTPQYGPRQILSAIITNIDFQTDPPYNGKKLCNPQECNICTKLCPTGAIGSIEQTKPALKSIRSKQIEVTPLKTNSCVVASMAMRKEFGGLTPVKDLIMTNDPTDEELITAFNEKTIDKGQGLIHFPSHFCDNCLIYCPVGNWKESFFDKGVSKYDGSNI